MARIFLKSGRNQEADNKSNTCYETKYTDVPCNNLGIGKGTLSAYVQATCLVSQQQVSRRMLVLSYLFHFALLVRQMAAFLMERQTFDYFRFRDSGQFLPKSGWG